MASRNMTLAGRALVIVVFASQTPYIWSGVSASG
jgi:hypothetical protein